MLVTLALPFPYLVRDRSDLLFEERQCGAKILTALVSAAGLIDNCTKLVAWGVRPVDVEPGDKLSILVRNPNAQWDGFRR